MMLEQDSLVAHLQNLENSLPDFWTFDGRDERYGAHGLFHYPAMMVPEMQGTILDALLDVKPTCKNILDPFVGSGTVLVESMMRGLNFTGVDINPLAILLCEVKATVLPIDTLKKANERIAKRITGDNGRDFFVKFSRQSKWFSKSSSIWLSRIARSIQAEQELVVRRVFWIALARVVRQVCNSRTSTYKLHKRKDEDLNQAYNYVQLFELASSHVIDRLNQHYEKLQEQGWVDRKGYKRDVSIHMGDTIDLESLTKKRFDIIVTSPPYGDNRTTIPYGQYSFLPLQWIPLEDISPNLSRENLKSSHSTDTASLGGSLAGAIDKGMAACRQFPTFLEVIGILKDDNCRKKFCSFAADLAESVISLSNITNSEGFHVWTVGERNINGHQIGLGKLLIEMLEEQDIIWVYTAHRKILSKRQAHRNRSSKTMGEEQIIIARKR